MKVLANICVWLAVLRHKNPRCVHRGLNTGTIGIGSKLNSRISTIVERMGNRVWIFPFSTDLSTLFDES
jgi:hypothetical protein